MSYSHEVRVPKTIGELPLKQIAPGIYLVHAPLENPNEENEGFIANTGFIVTDKGVVIIDPGSSVHIGRKLLQKIAEVTDKPVVAVFNTHIHGDHWLGNHAVVEKYPDAVIYAHERMIERLDSGEVLDWLQIMEELTKGATTGTKMYPPSIGLKGGDTLEVGEKQFNIYYKGKAHTDTDIMIEVKNDKTIFLGDIVMVGRLSSQPQDGDVMGQINAIKFARDTNNEVYVPGHGKSGGKEVPEKALAFVETLYQSVSKYYEEGLSDFEMKEQVMEDLSEYQHWSGFDSIGATISHTFLKVEEESF
jgi:glyoxylase-like metal-dependent hydrolase (beta-lactamase superfamily II)